MSSLSSMSDVSFGMPAERTVKARMRAARKERIDGRDICVECDFGYLDGV